MRRMQRTSLALWLSIFGAGTAAAVAELNYDELISVVFFEDENAYRDPTAFFCRFIAIEDKDDYCKASMTYIEPKLCKVEVTREFRATYGGGKGREFMKARDVFTLANLDLSKLSEPEIDDARKTSRQTFEAPINIKWHEGYQYSTLLDDKGAYRACVVAGDEKAISEEECARQGQQPYAGQRKISLLFNAGNYNRSMAAIRWLQKNYCPAGDPL